MSRSSDTTGIVVACIPHPELCISIRCVLYKVGNIKNNNNWCLSILIFLSHSSSDDICQSVRTEPLTLQNFSRWDTCSHIIKHQHAILHFLQEWLIHEPWKIYPTFQFYWKIFVGNEYWKPLMYVMYCSARDVTL